MKVIIVEDEILAQQELSWLIKEHSQMEIAATFDDGLDVLPGLDGAAETGTGRLQDGAQKGRAGIEHVALLVDHLSCEQDRARHDAGPQAEAHGQAVPACLAARALHEIGLLVVRVGYEGVGRQLGRRCPRGFWRGIGLGASWHEARLVEAGTGSSMRSSAWPCAGAMHGGSTRRVALSASACNGSTVASKAISQTRFIGFPL